MGINEHIFFFIIILLLAYLTYGALRLDFADRYYQVAKRTLPSFLVWPRNPKTYALLYKIGVVASLKAAIILYAFSVTRYLD